MTGAGRLVGLEPEPDKHFPVAQLLSILDAISEIQHHTSKPFFVKCIRI